ncbi:MAG TPA: cellulase N-terminal Ig-like domain-containing protein, partial [Planctomycetota bacterium]|nr:cellulase N-terminal Ig-like domain-containing protein [Planctomycetota bacterium]
MLRLASLLAIFTLSGSLFATDLAEALPLSDRWIMIHIDDGHVIHHKKGQKRSEEKAIVTPLDTARADKPATWTITSADDPAYKDGKAPARVGRKSKGTDFAWLCEKWENGRTVNVSPDHAKEHWIYLELPSPLKRGASYGISCGTLLPADFKLTFKFDEKSARSDAVHVNLIGYPIDAPKYGYIYQWMGDADCLDVKPLVGKQFDVVDPATGKSVFSGKVAFRAPKTQAETQHAVDSPPNGNFLKADVAECDFSALTQPGKYVLAVESVGCSYPFTIGADVYREAYITTTRGLYHNRSGIELKKPYTEFERPAPHNPKLTPGFAGKLVYTKSRFIDWKNGDNDPADKPAIEAGIVGPLDSAGWYQDAGDWDSYDAHLNVPNVLMLAYELAPQNFKDGELNIPESGNGVPDILDEAAWLPRFCARLRAELQQKKYGTGGIGLRICGDHFGGDGDGVPSYLDTHRQWIASGEDPLSTYHYAAVAAQMAWCLKKAAVADPEKIDWLKEAVESYRWADANTKPEDEKKYAQQLKELRAYAAAALFRLTGEAQYQERLAKETAWITPTTLIWH